MPILTKKNVEKLQNGLNDSKFEVLLHIELSNDKSAHKSIQLCLNK